MGYNDYEIKELINAANKIDSTEEDDLSSIRTLKSKLFDLFDYCQVPTEIRTEIDDVTHYIGSRGQYTFILDELNYSKENGLKLQMSYRTRDKKEHNIIMKKDENGNYMSITEKRGIAPAREGIVNYDIIRRTAKKNSDGLYVCETNKISYESALSGEYTRFGNPNHASPKTNTELLHTEILQGDRRIDLDEYNKITGKKL